MLKCVVYVSQEVTSFDEQMLSQLADHAALRNSEVGITGYLYYHNGNFTQYIEGKAESIDALLQVLHRDQRHSILCNYVASVESPRFANWSMKRITNDEFVEIQLEHVLTDHLIFVSQIQSRVTLNPEPLWRMVDRLVSLKGKLTAPR